MGSEMPQQFDDVLTELLIDKINLWFKTFKLNPSYIETNVSREALVDHVQRHVIQPNKITNAARELLKIPSVLEAAGVTSENEREFISHANRYFEMYLPNAGCEIAETPRYSGSDKREACIIATKKWQVGDEIKYCTGVLVPITSEEERALEGGRDFSIMWSTRKDCMCLLLGPARFVNHDCNPNTHFIATGQNTISFKLLRDVAVGEELTAHYGENYFGQGNEECLCVTCEQKQTGGFKKVRDEAEEEAYEGLRPFVYNDGRLVRRSMRRNKAIQFNNTTKNKSKLAPVRVNNKNMEVIDDDLIIGSSSHVSARAKSNKEDLAGNSNQDNVHFQSASDTSAQRTEYSTPMSMDMDVDISPVDNRAASTKIQMDNDFPRERITSVRAHRPVNSSAIARPIMRQRTFSEPISFKALFSATRIHSNTSVSLSNDNPSRSSQDVGTSDQELGTNILSTNVSQENRNNNYQPPRSNSASQDNHDGSTSRSTLQYPNRDSGMLLHTTITNSRANQEITTGLSIQSNVMSEQSSRTAPTVVPHISRGINSISISKFPRSTDDTGRSIVNNTSANYANGRSISRYDPNSVNRHESEPVHVTGTRERVSSIAPVTINHDNRGRSIINQTNPGFSRQHVDRRRLSAIGGMTGLATSLPINLNDSWAGVELTANPNLRVTWGIETTRQFIIPGNNTLRQRQLSSLSTAYIGAENNSRSTKTSRMSIAYLCSNDLHDDASVVINSSRNEKKLNVKRVCRVCREKFAPLPVEMTAHKCPRCSRHFSLYNLEWPLRKQPKEKGKAKETKNRGEAINRRDKKTTAIATMITTTNNNKGKSKQVFMPAISIGDKKEHNERMQAIIFAESNEEWLPTSGIDKEKYSVGEEQPTAGKAFSVSMKRRRNEKFATGEVWYKPFLRWSASTGYVHLNSVWRYVECHTSPDNNKLRVVKKKVKTSQSGFEGSGSFSLQGGYATYQGDWVPYEDAQKIVEELGQPELLRKFILPPGGNVVFTSSPLGTTSSKRKYEEVDAEDSDAGPSHKKRA